MKFHELESFSWKQQFLKISKVVPIRTITSTKIISKQPWWAQQSFWEAYTPNYTASWLYQQPGHKLSSWLRLEPCLTQPLQIIISQAQLALKKRARRVLRPRFNPQSLTLFSKQCFCGFFDSFVGFSENVVSHSFWISRQKLFWLRCKSRH